MTPSQQLPSASSEHNAPAADAPLARPAHSWLLLGIELLLVVAGCALLWPTMQSLIVEWEDTDNTTYTHGYLIGLIFLWLLWRERNDLAQRPIKPNLLAAVMLAGASLVWLVSLRSGINTGAQVMLPAMLWLAVCSAFGWRPALLVAFAFGYLYFAIPVWGAINNLLQWATVVAVDLLMRTTGVSAWVDGTTVHLAAGTFEIAGGCSGLHFFIVGLALATLYGEMHRDSLSTRLKVIALAVVLALITNWVRVYCIILAGYLTDMQHYLVRVEHYRFGWVVFAVMMAVFFFIAHRLPATERMTASADPAAAPILVHRELIGGTALAIAAFAIGPLWNVVVPLRGAMLPAADAWLPTDPGAWKGPQTANELQWNPVFTGADAQHGGAYRRDSRMVQLYTAAYAWQTQGKELVGYGNTLVETGSAELSRQSASADGHAVEMIVANAAGEQSVLWYSYLLAEQPVSDGVAMQLAYGVTSLAEPPVARVTALRTACVPDCDAARRALQDFAQSSGWPKTADKDESLRDP